MRLPDASKRSVPARRVDIGHYPLVSRYSQNGEEKTMKRSTLIGVWFPLAVSIGLSGSAGAEDAQARNTQLYRESYQAEANRDYATATARMRDITDHGEKTYYAVVRIAWLAYLSGDFAASEASYREAAAMSPKAVEPRLGMTLPLMAAKKWRDAERACRDVLALDPNHAMARARLGRVLYMEGNYPDSATVYRKLMDEYPAELDHQTGLAWAMLRLGRRADARALFQAVLTVSPDNVNAKQGIAAP